MKYYEVTVKFGHVGKNKYYKGNIYIKAENGKEAASKARSCPRVKHDHKDAILSVTELDYETFQELWKHNEEISYFSCYIMFRNREIVFAKYRTKFFMKHNLTRNL